MAAAWPRFFAPWSKQRIIVVGYEARGKPASCSGIQPHYLAARIGVERKMLEGRPTGGLAGCINSLRAHAVQNPLWYAAMDRQPRNTNRKAFLCSNAFARLTEKEEDLAVKTFGPHGLADTAEMDTLVVRNHTRREYVRGMDFAKDSFKNTRHFDTIHLVQPILVNHRVVSIARPCPWELGELVATVTRWGSFQQGIWAGHRLDIVPLHTADLNGWTNALDSVLSQFDMGGPIRIHPGRYV